MKTNVKQNKVGSQVSINDTKLSYNQQNRQGKAINSNGRLTPDASLLAVLPRTANQQSILFPQPTPNGAAMAIITGTSRKRRKK